MQQGTSMYQMNTNKYVFFMSLPIFVELMLQLLVGNVDQVMISAVSEKSVAAIVNANQIINLIIVVITTAAGSTIVVLSNYLGSNDRENSSKTCAVSMVLIGIGSLLATIVIFVFVDPLLHYMNVPYEILEETKTYLLIVAASSLFQGLYLNYSAILRTFTLMKETMYVAIIMNIIHIMGNTVLINGWFGLPQMGVLGAAISTVISKALGLAIIMVIYKNKVNLPMRFCHLKPFSLEIVKRLCLLAVPSSAESLSYQLSQLCILGIINSFGTMVTVTKGYCSILANLSYVYVVALAQAMQIVLGYLIGAKMPNEIQKRVQATQKIAVLICVSMAAVLFLGSPWLFLFFTKDPEVIKLGQIILGIEIALEIGRAINIVMTRTLIAVGDIKTPTVVGISFHWAVALSGAYVFGKLFGWGLPGVWIAMAVEECARGLIYVIKFKKEDWKKAFPAVPALKVVD